MRDEDINYKRWEGDLCCNWGAAIKIGVRVKRVGSRMGGEDEEGGTTKTREKGFVSLQRDSI